MAVLTFVSPDLRQLFTRGWIAFGLLLAAGCARESATSLDLSCPECSLVLISIDTLRADHLSCYGYHRVTSPRIDAFAASATVFERAYSPSYHTADSHMSIFTGLRPSVHRVRNARGGRDTEGLSPSVPTFVETLRGHGFRTAGFHGGGNVSGPYGFNRGFEIYQATLNDLAPAVEWIRERSLKPKERFFLFAHSYRTHDPYLPDPPHDLWSRGYSGNMFPSRADFESALVRGDFAERRELFWSRVDPSRAEDLQQLVALYDGAIRQVDAELTPLLDALDSLSQPTMVVLVSDHGEEFFEHGGRLHDQVYEETLHVPWILRHPGGRGAGQRIAARLSLLDLAPTLLDALGAPPLATAQGKSLVPALRAGIALVSRPIVAEKVVGDVGASLRPSDLKQALIAGDLKLIAFPEGHQRLFDLRRDPGERVDISRESVADLQRLLEALSRQNARSQALFANLADGRSAVVLEQTTIEQLKALGYL